MARRLTADERARGALRVAEARLDLLGDPKTDTPAQAEQRRALTARIRTLRDTLGIDDTPPEPIGRDRLRRDLDL